MDILHIDPDLVAVDKPPGLLVHRSAIDRHETRYALQILRDQLGQRVYPVHRLDKPTSGVLLFALNVDTAQRLTQQFAAGQVRKTYLAVVRGHALESASIDYALREELDPMTDALADAAKPAQPAITHYRRLATAELPYPVGRYPTCRYSVLEVNPATGRKHQIRRHMKHIFHPVIGDTTHGDGRHNQFFREHIGCRRLLLAATGLDLIHPRTGAALSLRAGLDDEFQRALRALGCDALRPGGDANPYSTVQAKP